MANTNIDILTPEFWAASFESADYGLYNLHRFVSTKFDNLLANYGDTVHMPLVPSLDAADDWVAGDVITSEDITQERIDLILDTSKKKTITLNGKELSMSPYELISTYGAPMAQVILEALNVSIATEMAKANQVIDGSTLTEDSIVDLKVLMDNNKCSSVGRNLIMSASDVGSLLKRDAFQYVQNSADTNAQREGILTRKFGFNISETHAIADRAPADLVGAVNNGAGYSTGGSTMIVDGFDDDADLIRPGDRFTVVGDTTKHYVSASSLTTGDTTSITFYPALGGDVLDDAVITFTSSRGNIALHPSAFGLAMRVYNIIPAGSGVKQTVINHEGMPIRISVWHDGKLGINIQFDILYGCKLVHQNRIARLVV